MNRLKSELGSDAIILSTRTVRQKGLFGFFRKPLIEIIAAYEKENSANRKSRTDENLVRINRELSDIKRMVANINLNEQKGKQLHPKIEKYWRKLISKWSR